MDIDLIYSKSTCRKTGINRIKAITMNSKERFLNALAGKKTDRLPVTTHHLMPSFLKNYMNGISDQEFFDFYGLDPVKWSIAHTFDKGKGEYFDPTQKEIGFLEARRICTDNWRFSTDEIYGLAYPTRRMNIITPVKTLSMVLQSDEHTTWLSEHVIKEKSDIDILAKYMPSPKCDAETINKEADDFGNRGLFRGHIPCFDGFGQPGCWQDAACMYGIENLIMATFMDPGWVHSFLGILQARKKIFIESLKGVKYDILELGGGDASTTVISPDIFNTFVAPYDAPLIEAAHKAGQRISYHTCGGMMPILEDIASMNPDAMETFSPPAMGGDTDLAEAKKRIGDKVCMIGGFDQFHFFTGCTENDTRNEVRRCFEAAGKNGGFILSPSDHFFEADLKLIKAFAEEAQRCIY
jgi:uroporphyrinogen decarboxylase